MHLFGYFVKFKGLFSTFYVLNTHEDMRIVHAFSWETQWRQDNICGLILLKKHGSKDEIEEKLLYYDTIYVFR